MKRAIVWFKTDIRSHDNETLFRAMEQSDEIIPVYCIDDVHFTTSEYGFKKNGNFRAQFLLESLIDLDKSLRSIGSGLIVVRGKPEIEIPALVIKYKVDKVFAKKEFVHEELITQNNVEHALANIDCLFESYSTDTLYHQDDLPFSLNDIPNVFTDFRRKIERESSVRELFPAPSFIKSPPIEMLQLPELEQLGLEQVKYDERAVVSFNGGETEGINRLHHYLTGTHAIATYKQSRNGMIGSDYSSKFSAWLAMGCLSPSLIYHEIKKYESQFTANESTYWLIFELLWRDFFSFMFKKYPVQFFHLNGIKNKQTTIAQHNDALFEKWKNGKTGNDFIDANMLELKLTGFMSNRGRQNVASFFCHDLKLDWRYGAAYFEQQLIDYDVCSNWGNWAYIAGVGNSPRNGSVFNVDKQANDYDKDKSYRNLWLQHH